jgi:HK97 family phage major capsid protein
MTPIERLREQRATNMASAEAILATAEADDRELTEDEFTQITEARTLDTQYAERLAELASFEEQRAAVASAPTVIRTVPVEDQPDVRNLTPGELRDRGLKALEARVGDYAHEIPSAAMEQVERMLRSGRTRSFDAAVVARRLLITETPAYRSAWAKTMTNPNPVLTVDEQRALLAWEEFRAMSIGTDTSGGFGVPVLIDPSIILTAQGSLNPFRSIARVIPITNDEWKGVSSAGITWSIDAEAAAVSDDTPTLAQPTVTTGMGRGFVPFSIQVGGDYPGFAAEIATLLVEGYDELQAAHFCTGSTSATNRGLLTALDANTNVEVVTTTDGAFGAVDVNKAWGALPDRYKQNAVWMMNHDVGNEVGGFSTSGAGSYFTVTLADDNTPRLKGRPVAYASNFPDFTGTTGASNILVVGDFRNYVIADRVGMTTELVPHLFDVTNNLPTGSRGFFAWARFGANSVNDLGFRLLQNQ